MSDDNPYRSPGPIVERPPAETGEKSAASQVMLALCGFHVALWYLAVWLRAQQLALPRPAFNRYMMPSLITTASCLILTAIVWAWCLLRALRGDKISGFIGAWFALTFFWGCFSVITTLISLSRGL